MEKLFNVFIVEDKNGKAVKLIGSNLNERKAEVRENSGLMRIDCENFTVISVEVGSKEDQEFMSNLSDN